MQLGVRTWKASHGTSSALPDVTIALCLGSRTTLASLLPRSGIPPGFHGGTGEPGGCIDSGCSNMKALAAIKFGASRCFRLHSSVVTALEVNSSRGVSPTLVSHLPGKVETPLLHVALTVFGRFLLRRDPTWTLNMNSTVSFPKSLSYK